MSQGMDSDPLGDASLSGGSLDVFLDVDWILNTNWNQESGLKVSSTLQVNIYEFK